MNAGRARKNLGAGRKTTKKNTTLYDLLDDLNTKFFGPQWEHTIHPGKETMEVGHYSPVTEKVDQMFEEGQIRFKNPQLIQKHYVELFT